MKCSEIRKHIYTCNKGKDLPPAILDHVKNCKSCEMQLHSLFKMLDTISSVPVPSRSDSDWQKLNDSILSALDNSPSCEVVKIKTFSTWRISAVAALIAISLLFTPALIHLISNSKGVQIIHVIGYASSGVTQVKADSRISDGSELTTGNNSSLEIRTDHASILSLGERTTFKINSAKKDRQIFSLSKGSLAAKVSKRTPGQIFRIQTPNGFCEVVGTRFLVDVSNNGDRLQCRTRLIVQEGVVKFGNRKDITMVKAGDSAIIEGEKLHTKTVLKTNCKEEFKKSQLSISKSPVSESENVIIGKSASLDSTGSEYQKANALLDCGRINDALAHFNQILKDKKASKQLQVIVLNKAAACCKLLGNVAGTLENYNTIMCGDFSKNQKESALFQIALIKYNEIHDFDGAETALKNYMDRYPDGLWIEDAYSTLAELLFLTKKYANAAQTYEIFIHKFHNNRQREKSIYELAQIYCRDLKDYRKAISTFSGLLEEYPTSKFTEDAIFWSADCKYNLGLISESVKDYESYLSKYPEGKWVPETKLRLNKKETAGVSR